MTLIIPYQPDTFLPFVPKLVGEYPKSEEKNHQAI
jgi:hypothetical protein